MTYILYSFPFKSEYIYGDRYIPTMVKQSPNFQYFGLVLERQTLHHYSRTIRLSNSESGDLIP
jgi:hypothetical protein